MWKYPATIWHRLRPSTKHDVARVGAAGVVSGIQVALASNPLAVVGVGILGQVLQSRLDSFERALSPEARRRLFETPELQQTLISALRAVEHARADENVRLIASIAAGTAYFLTDELLDPTDTLLDVAGRLSPLESRMLVNLCRESGPQPLGRILPQSSSHDGAPMPGGVEEWGYVAMGRLLSYGLARQDVVGETDPGIAFVQGNDGPTYVSTYYFATGLGRELVRRAETGKALLNPS